MENLKEIDEFLEKYNLPKLNQKEIENLTRSIKSTEIETVKKKKKKIFKQTKYQNQLASQVNSTEQLKT